MQMRTWKAMLMTMERMKGQMAMVRALGWQVAILMATRR